MSGVVKRKKPRLPKIAKRGLFQGYERKFARWDPKGKSSSVKDEIIKDMMGAIEYASTNRRKLYVPADYSTNFSLIKRLRSNLATRKAQQADREKEIRRLNKEIKDRDATVARLLKRPTNSTIALKDKAKERVKQNLIKANRQIRGLKLRIETLKKRQMQARKNWVAKKPKVVVKTVKNPLTESEIRTRWLYQKPTTAGKVEVYKISYFTEKFLIEKGIKHQHLNCILKISLHPDSGIKRSELRGFGDRSIHYLSENGYTGFNKVSGLNYIFLTPKGHNIVKEYYQYVKTSLKHEPS